MPQEFPFLLLVAGTAMLALLLAGWQLLISRKLKGEISRLEKQLQLLQATQEKKASFATSLNRAEREQPSLPSGVRKTPEKYHYVAALADQGLDVQGIAKALKLAPAEVEQLLQLARLRPSE